MISNASKKVETIRFKAMGSSCQLKLQVENNSRAKHFIELALAEIQRLEQKYSRYLGDSLLTKLNKAGEQQQVLDEESVALLNYADQIYGESGGLFDITSGVLRRVWNFREAQVPLQCEIDAILPSVGWDKVNWLAPYFSMPNGMELDLGGLVKEYAADAAAKVLLENGLQSGLVELGGDIRVIGDNQSEFAWPIGIKNPRKPQEALIKIKLSEGALASSGDYERCIILDGKRYSHILNPKTAWPVAAPASVSVLADNCLLAGTISTVAMLHGEDACLDWLDSVELPYLVVFCDGRVVNKF